MNSFERAARTAALGERIRAHGGIAHTRDLKADGYSCHDMVLAVEAGAIQRIRRSWLVIPDCDPSRKLAASLSGRVTCITAAKSRGLWMPPLAEVHPHPHIAVRPTASRVHADGVTVHWASGPVVVAPTEVLDPIVNVLFHIARCLPVREALTVWESAVRKRLVDATLLARVSWRSTRARALAEAISAHSDSGLETLFVSGMHRLGVTVRQQVLIEGHQVDGLIGERLVVQIDGFEFHQAADRRRDIRHDSQLVLRGYVVLRFDYHQILFDWPRVEQTVIIAMAQGLHLAR